MSNSPDRVTALQVAGFFIEKSSKAGKPITNKKLQKLVYYAQVWSLAINNEKLFPERIEAWVHGPAVPTLYRRFRAFEFNPIVLDKPLESGRFTTKQRKLLDSVWAVYGKYNAAYLEALTHSELPWQEARKDTPV